MDKKSLFAPFPQIVRAVLSRGASPKTHRAGGFRWNDRRAVLEEQLMIEFL